MRIAVDARPLCVPTFGIGRYTERVLNELIGDATVDVDWHLYADRPLRVNFADRDRVITRSYSGVNHMFSLYRTQVAFSRWAREDGIDVFWSPRHHLPFMLPDDVKSVVTIHDLVWRYYPETMMWANRIVERTLMPASVKRADKIICVSESTQLDLVRQFPGVEGRTVVIPLAASPGPSELFQPDLTEPYFLFVGTLEPRKNLARLLEAYKEVANRGVSHHLVIAGAKGWESDIASVITGLALSERVHVLGHVSEPLLHGLYQGATALMLPSLYEGFGLPALEAMQYGIPVIGSNVASIPEVVGQGGILVDPQSTAEITSAMVRIVENESIWQELSVRAREQAALFSWRRTARETLDVLVG